MRPDDPVERAPEDRDAPHRSVTATSALTRKRPEQEPLGRVVERDVIVANADVSPMFPTMMRSRMIRRRTGWFITSSASRVVNPTPKKAETAWKWAVSSERPVRPAPWVATRTRRTDER